MNIQRCQNGHYFDAERYSEGCPYCRTQNPVTDVRDFTGGGNKTDNREPDNDKTLPMGPQAVAPVSDNPGVTMPVETPSVVESDEDATMPIEAPAPVETDEGATMPIPERTSPAEQAEAEDVAPSGPVNETETDKTAQDTLPISEMTLRSIKKCKNNHLYNGDRYSECPYCKNNVVITEIDEPAKGEDEGLHSENVAPEPVETDEGVTMPVETPAPVETDEGVTMPIETPAPVEADEGVTMPIEASAPVEADEGVTMPITPPADSAEQASENDNYRTPTADDIINSENKTPYEGTDEGVTMPIAPPAPVEADEGVTMPIAPPAPDETDEGVTMPIAPPAPVESDEGVTMPIAPPASVETDEGVTMPLTSQPAPARIAEQDAGVTMPVAQPAYPAAQAASQANTDTGVTMPLTQPAATSYNNEPDDGRTMPMDYSAVTGGTNVQQNVAGENLSYNEFLKRFIPKKKRNLLYAPGIWALVYAAIMLFYYGLTDSYNILGYIIIAVAFAVPGVLAILKKKIVFPIILLAVEAVLIIIAIASGEFTMGWVDFVTIGTAVEAIIFGSKMQKSYKEFKEKGIIPEIPDDKK